MQESPRTADFSGLDKLADLILAEANEAHLLDLAQQLGGVENVIEILDKLYNALEVVGSASEFTLEHACTLVYWAEQLRRIDGLQDVLHQVSELSDIIHTGTSQGFAVAEYAWLAALNHAAYSPFLSFTSQEALAGWETLQTIGVDMNHVHQVADQLVEPIAELLRDLAADLVNLL